MATSVRTLFKFFLGVFAALSGIGNWSRAAEPRPAAAGPAETLTMSTFISRIRQDEGLRARFADSPRAVLREFGIDPPPINLPDRINPVQMQGLLNNWAAGVEPAEPPPNPGRFSAPAPIYGPPAGPPPPGPNGGRFSAPAVIYGPPAGPPPPRQP
jgi:hypothetical protein